MNFALPVFAGNKNVGTSGAAFLKIGAGARPAGMGEAYTAIADDVNAIAWNPAGLGSLSTSEFTAMHTQWFQEGKYEYAAGATPFSWGTLGVSFASLSIDGIEKRLEDTETPVGTFDSLDAAYTLAYGKTIGQNWRAGGSACFIRQTLSDKSATAFSGSVGGLWRTPHEPLTLGLTVRHFGTKPKFDKEGDPLPLTTTLGTGYRLFSDRLTLGLDLRQPRDNDLQYGVGAEWTHSFPWELKGALRAGYNSAGTDPTDGLVGLSIGLGLSWRDWGFNTAWVPYGILGNTFRYAILVKF